MSFVFLKFLHVAFMFMGAALAVGPAALLYLLARSGDLTAIRRAFAHAERIFQISTACYGLGIIFGFAAAFVGTLDLTAGWLLMAYVLVALLGGHGILSSAGRGKLRVASPGPGTTTLNMPSALAATARRPTYSARWRPS